MMDRFPHSLYSDHGQAPYDAPLRTDIPRPALPPLALSFTRVLDGDNE